MGKTPNRRDFLRAGLNGFAAMALARAGFGAAAQAATGEFTTDRLGDGLFRIGGAGGNVVVLSDTEGAVVVDSGAPETAAALADYVRAETGGAPLRALLNTHWHLPHTGGNERLREDATRIIAHENTRLWMSTEYYVRWQDKTYQPRPAAALPTDTFFASDPQPRSLEHGAQRIEYAHLPEAHTDGDIYVLFPAHNVIVAGDVVAVGAYPVPDHATGGWIGGLIDATSTLIGLSDAGTRIVPGTGPAVTRADLEAQRDMLTTVQQRVADLMREGRSAAEMVAAGVTREFDADRGDPAQFVANVYDGMWWGGRLGGTL